MERENRKPEWIHKQWTGSKKYPHMPMAERAKIFLPFSALKGYEAAIEAKKKIRVSKKELSEDMKETLDRKLHEIMYFVEQGTHPMVTVIFFLREKDGTGEEGEYLKLTGMVGKVDLNNRWIQIVGQKINFADIRSLTLEENSRR